MIWRVALVVSRVSAAAAVLSLSVVIHVVLNHLDRYLLEGVNEVELVWQNDRVVWQMF